MSGTWVYPPRINQTLRDAFYEQSQNSSVGDWGMRMRELIRSTIYNSSLSERSERPDHLPFGSDEFPVHSHDIMTVALNDVVYTRDDEMSLVRLDCIACRKGSEGGPIFEACGNYTETDQVATTSSNITTPGNSLRDEIAIKMPRYLYTGSDYVPEGACGVCLFTLCEAKSDTCAQDHSIPFPMKMKTRTPYWEFNNNEPTGVSSSVEPSETEVQESGAATPVIPLATETPHVFPNHEKELILGISIPLTIIVIAVMVWLLMRKRNKRKAIAYGSAEANTSEGIQMGTGVPETQVIDEPPPSYNEVMTGGHKKMPKP